MAPSCNPSGSQESEAGGGGLVQGQPRAYGEFPVSKISGDICKVSEYICPCFAQWTTVILSCRECIPIPLVESR